MNEPISLEVRRAEPIPALIECLESLLDRAKTGELRTLVYWAFEREGTWESGNSGDVENRQLIFGAMMQTMFDFYSRRRESDGLSG